MVATCLSQPNTPLNGPLVFGFILQPLMSMLFATRDGIRDVRSGDPVFAVFPFEQRPKEGVIAERMEGHRTGFPFSARAGRDLSVSRGLTW
jgi:hypothetical protein